MKRKQFEFPCPSAAEAKFIAWAGGASAQLGITVREFYQCVAKYGEPTNYRRPARRIGRSWYYYSHIVFPEGIAQLIPEPVDDVREYCIVS